MPGDLFVQSLTPPQAPKRSRWTIVGSILAHVALVGAILIVPVLSAFDSFVVRANNALTYTMPIIAMPVAPPPPSTAPKMASDINPAAAPPQAPEKPVTSEVLLPPPGIYVPGGRDHIPGGGSGNVPGGSSDIALGTAPPAPSPTPVGPVRPGGDIKPPSRVSYVAPNYPALARTAHVEGTVYLEATIDEHGVVRDVRVLRGNALLDEAARAAVSQWRYTPTKLNGVAVPVILTVTVTFTLR